MMTESVKENDMDPDMAGFMSETEDPWSDLDDLWRAELPDAPEAMPDRYAYQDGITPDDWEIAERVARRWKRNTNDRALAVAAVDRDIAELQERLRELEAAKRVVSLPFDRREEYLRFRYFDFLQAFTTAATQGKRERYVQIVNTRLSLTHKSASFTVVDEEKALAWAAKHTPDAVKRSLLKTPLNKWFADTGEVPGGCEPVPEFDSFSMKVGG